MTSARAAAAQSQAVRAMNTTNTTAGFLAAIGPQLSSSLPPGVTLERMQRLIMTVVRQSELDHTAGTTKHSLTECTDVSFLGAVLTLGALGLEPTNGEAYLVPYENKKARTVEAQLIVGYRGHSRLFLQHPLARHCDAQPVYERDVFDATYGTTPTLVHKPALGNRGKVIAYYGVATLTTGATNFAILTPEDVYALRGKAGPNGGIKDPMAWMERKTALIQALKLMPKSAVAAAALDADEASGTRLWAERSAHHVAELRDDPAPVGAAPAPAGAISATAPAPAAEAINYETGEVALEGQYVPADPAHDGYNDAAWLGGADR